MFPVSDFNFVVAGIATFAATVGYTYARKLSTTMNGGISDNDESKDHVMTSPSEKAQPSPSPSRPMEPSSSIVTWPPVRRDSLKRKEPHGGFEQDDTQDLGYPYNLANIYPRKRCRTPSTDSDDKGKRSIEEPTTLLFSEDPLTQDDWIFIPPVNSPNTVFEEPPRTPSPGAETLGAPTPAAEITDSPLIASIPIHTTEAKNEPDIVPSGPESDDTLATGPATGRSEPEVVSNSLAEAEQSDTATSTSIPIPPPPKISLEKPTSSPFKTRGFAEFAGSKVPFGAFSVPRGSGSRPSRAIWSADGTTFATPAPRIEDKDESEDASLSGSEQHAITQAPPAVKPATTHVTGEENEDVEMELKSVKLFIKRGNKPFAEGMVGHVKLLSDRATLNERLLFRREPLWKVSMNIRINSSVRCTYDANEHVLRILTQERPTTESGGQDDEKSLLEVVIYAMKPGRSCSKHDFKEFVETLIKNPRFESS